MLHTLDVVVWDFDGVLNRNYGDGGFFWNQRLEADHGICFRAFGRRLFETGQFVEIISGRLDLVETVRPILAEFRCPTPADEFVRYWFEKDSYICADMLAIVADVRARGVRTALGTNSCPHRIRYIRDGHGLGEHLDHLLGSGVVGAAKPEPAFFQGMADALEVREPSRILLIDDMRENVEAARASGWRAIQYGDYSTLVLGDPHRLRRELGLDVHDAQAAAPGSARTARHGPVAGVLR